MLSQQRDLRTQAILRALPDLIFLQDAATVYLDCCARDPRELPAPPDQFLGRPMREVLPPDLTAAFERCFREARETGGPALHEYALVVGGQLQHYEARVVMCNDAFLSVVRNVSERKKAPLAQARLRASGIVPQVELADGLPAVKVQRVQIQQVVLNLLNNAVDAIASRRAGSREVFLRSSRNPEGSVRVSIGDGGVGLAGVDVDRMFKPFYTTKPDGLGMGLAISRTIVEAHGGHIWAEPRQPSGVTIHFTIPAVG